MDKCVYFKNTDKKPLELPRRVHNVSLQAKCYECERQEPYIDAKGVIRCYKNKDCRDIIHYSKAMFQRHDSTDESKMYAVCSSCGHMVYRPAEKTTCFNCGCEVIWDEEDI